MKLRAERRRKQLCAGIAAFRPLSSTAAAQGFLDLLSSKESQMDVSGMFSDDQLAVIGCFFALAVCGFVAAMSFHFGPKGREQRQIQTSRTRTLSIDGGQDQTQRQDRRAA